MGKCQCFPALLQQDDEATVSKPALSSDKCDRFGHLGTLSDRDLQISLYSQELNTFII